MMNLAGYVRRFGFFGPGAQREMRLTGIESLSVAQVEDTKAELARAGRRFGGGNQIIANGIAPVSAIPTTTATLALFNGEDSGGRSLIIDRICFWLGSGTPAAGATLFATVSPSKIATPPTANATGYGSQSLSGSSMRTKAVWATGVTVPSMPAAPNWIAIQSTFQLAAANVGQGDTYSEMSGALVVPPQYALGFGILSGAGTTPLYGISVTWSETALDLE